MVRMTKSQDIQWEPYKHFSSASGGHVGAGFHTEGGPGIPPPPPPKEILKLSMVIIISYLHVTEHKYVSSKCSEILSQIVSEAI